MLLKQGAKVDYKSEDGTALIAAINNNNKNIVDLLIQYGSNIDLKHIWGITPLEYAYYKALDEMVKAFIEVGASLPKPLKDADVVATPDSTLALLIDAGAFINANLQPYLRFSHFDFTNKVVIGLKIDGKVVTRERTGFENAITTPGEFASAIKKGVKFEMKALKNTCERLLLQNPKDKNIKDFKNCFWFLPADNLTKMCLNFLNEPKSKKLRQIALGNQYRLPNELKYCLNPDTDEETLLNTLKNGAEKVGDKIKSFLSL